MSHIYQSHESFSAENRKKNSVFLRSKKKIWLKTELKEKQENHTVPSLRLCLHLHNRLYANEDYPINKLQFADFLQKSTVP